jgi:hypothetical protein
MRVKNNLSNDTSDKKESVERRVDLKRAPNKESLETDRMASLVLAEKQARNQETAQHEKQIHTRPSGACEEARFSRMMEKDGDDGHTTENVQAFVSHLLLFTRGNGNVFPQT